MKKRLFIAIELPEQLKYELSDYQQEIIKDLEIKPRLTVKENLHITLSFLGGVEETLIDGLMELLKEIQKTIKSFTLQFNETIYAPPGRFRSMIWVVYEKSDEYTQLTKLVNSAVVSCLKKHHHPIYLSSHQKPIPHITIARFEDKISNINHSFPTIPTKSLVVNSITLMQSQLSSKGPIYTDLDKFPFN